ncbi:MAG: type II secretion system protein GspF [Rhodanobacter sp.]|nr:MAG: type II secretion system protein GspF [Rhodanobacter sp.]TAL93082.1 MAG: type II secretion system protein GspF [Rhodanobacter sp.]TAM40525.1 MAG: type II secretion system protein GspF [Rhodanobacter sp.]TAN28600.1 MAG: type II secretion system protein GspF [Rhodanobacter sp.]
MEAFRYEALDASGHTVSGVLQADTARQARTQLRAQGLLPAAVDRVLARERAGKAWARGLSATELSLVTRQLATLLTSGLTLEQSLNALIEEAAEPLTREVLTGVKTEVTAGSSLALALGAYEKSFPDFYRALVHGGAESGALPTVLQHLADYLDTRQALRQKTSLALLYPILVTIVALAIVTGLLVYVVPQVVQVFQQSRQSLPWLTRALIALSNFLRATWPYLVSIIVGTTVAARMALRRPTTRRRWHALLLRLPWLGSLIRGVNTSRFASTLAILVGGGVPLLAALDSGAQVMTNLVMREALEHATERVREGASLARALGETRAFPPLLVHLVASGEVSGQLEQMLERAAQLETQSLERRLAVFLTLLEPVMILVMGGVVLMIVLAILLPIMEMNQLVH